jgi:hypothetical protein
MADAGCQTNLVDEEFGGVEDAGGLGEELVLRRAVGFKIWLVEGAGGLLDREVLRQRTLPQSGDQRSCRGSHGAGFVHHLAGFVEQAARQVLAHLGWEETQFAALDGRNQTGPEDGAATEVELRLLADVVLRTGISALPERVAAEVLRHGRVREAREVVDVRGVEERPRLDDQDPLLVPDAVSQIIGEHASADARTDDDDVEVEVVPRSDVLEEEPLLGFGRLRRSSHRSTE